MNDLKLVIVTGGTHGIGRACVQLFANEGYKVLFTGRDTKAGAAVEASCENAVFERCDVAVDSDCEAVAKRALLLGNGRISGLINNAGMGMRSGFDETTIADWDRVMNVNSRSVYLMTRLTLAGLRAAKGSVVTVSSVAGLAGQRGLALYAASKSSLIGLTQSLALEYGAEVRFNAIAPGQIATRMMGRVINDPVLLAKTVSTIPAARLGTADEVAQVALWLVSDASSFVNGTIIPVDGGEMAGIFDAD